MKQDKQENNNDEGFVEQDTLGPPDEYFYISDVHAANLAKFAGQSFTISGSLLHPIYELIIASQNIKYNSIWTSTIIS